MACNMDPEVDCWVMDRPVRALEVWSDQRSANCSRPGVRCFKGKPADETRIEELSCFRKIKTGINGMCNMLYNHSVKLTRHTVPLKKIKALPVPGTKGGWLKKCDVHHCVCLQLFLAPLNWLPGIQQEVSATAFQSKQTVRWFIQDEDPGVFFFKDPLEPD